MSQYLWSAAGGRNGVLEEEEVSINRKSGENREMIRWRAVGGRERWGE